MRRRPDFTGDICPGTRKPLVSLVVPFHDEAEAIDAFFATTLPILESIDATRFEIVCVNDGSRDDTLGRLIDVAAGDPRVRIVDLTRRFGKEAALTAGIDEAAGTAVILIDADLQDPPALIPAMVERWLAGAEVVAAKRTDRRCDPLMQRVAAALYYRVHNHLRSRDARKRRRFPADGPPGRRRCARCPSGGAS